MHDDFVLLAVTASFYVVRYPLTHPYPIVCSTRFPNHFISPGMTGRRVVVYEGHQLSFSRFGGYQDNVFDE